jgi:hypothetical protein
MRAIVGVLGLLIVLAIVGILAKMQLGHVGTPPAAPNGSGITLPVVSPDAAPQQQNQQMQQQIQQSVEGAMQARPMPDDTK